MWQGIESAPKDGTVHIRGLWVNVHSDTSPSRKEWRAYIGIIRDESGRFVDPEYWECYGWDAEDYTHWMPLPEPPK